jgi:hypothetical protein
MAKKLTRAKTKAKRKPPKPDFSQNALAGVEKLIGGKLSDGLEKRSGK